MTLLMDITRWSYRNQIIFFADEDGDALSMQSAKTRPGADRGLDHEPLIAKFRPNLKKVGKTPRPYITWPTKVCIVKAIVVPVWM